MRPNLRTLLRLVLGGWLLAAVGCSLTSKSEPLQPRYFSPLPAVDTATGAPGASSGQALRLRAVTAAEHLKANIVYQTSAFEYGRYETLRWTQRPADYVRRALGRALFEERGLQRSLAGSVPTLEVELAAFEEVQGGKPRGRVQLVLLLHRDQAALLEQSITVEQPLGGVGPTHLAQALGEALGQAVQQAANAVQAKLGEASGS